MFLRIDPLPNPPSLRGRESNRRCTWLLQVAFAWCDTKAAAIHRLRMAPLIQLREIALTFAREGARVSVNDIFEESAAAVAGEIVKAGGEALAVPADVADGRAALKMFTRFLTVWDSLDVLVNNAGILFMAPHVAEHAAKGMMATVEVGA